MKYQICGSCKTFYEDKSQLYKVATEDFPICYECCVKFGLIELNGAGKITLIYNDLYNLADTEKKENSFIETVQQTYKIAIREELSKKELRLIDEIKEKILELAENRNSSYTIYGSVPDVRIQRISEYFEKLGFTCQYSVGSLEIKWA